MTGVVKKMDMSKAGMALFVLAALVSSPLSADSRYRDVLTTVDGTTYVGAIIEQTPGEELVVETPDGELLTLSISEISSMEKQAIPPGEPAPEYTDVVFLTDGVIFRGTLIEQVLGESVELETENGGVLAVDMEDVWKLAREKKVAEEAESKARDRRIRELELDLQINIVMDRSLVDSVLETEEEKRTPSRDSDEQRDRQERLEEELEWLREELGSVDQEKKEEKEAETQQKGRDLQDMAEEMLRIVNEALQVEALADEERQMLERAAADIGRLVDEFVRDTAVLRDPEPDFALQDAAEQVVVQESTSELEALCRSGDWRKSSRIEDVKAMARNLDEDEKQELYRDHRKRGAVVAVLQNAMPILAAGSWKQKDLVGALACNAASIAGLVLLGFGFDVTPSAVEGPLGNISVRLNALGYAGIGLAGGAYVFSLIRPVLYAAGWNTDLSEALDLGGGPQR